jgi:hypothetical protein
MSIFQVIEFLGELQRLLKEVIKNLNVRMQAPIYVGLR